MTGAADRTGELYVDGASFSNPGPSGTGVVLIVDGGVVAERSDDTGYGTNNEAEYRAVAIGLREALDRGVTHLTVRSDSQLLVRQMNGEYKVRKPNLQTMKSEVDALAARFGKVRFEHIPREDNARADALAKEGAESAEARGVRRGSAT